MSIFGSIGKFFKKVLNFLKKLLKKAWVWIAIIILILLFIFCPPCAAAMMAAWSAIVSAMSALWGFVVSGASALASWFGGLSWAEAAKIALGAAVLLDPDGALDAVGGVVGDVVNGITSSKYFPFILGGVALWLLLGASSKRGRGEPQVVQIRQQSTSPPARRVTGGNA